MLSIDNLSVKFMENSTIKRSMVDRVNIHIGSGKTVAVIGETGSGKSLLGLSICGLLPPAAKMRGTVRFGGRDLAKISPKQMRKILGSRIAYVPQSAGLSLNPTMRCKYQVAEVFRRKSGQSPSATNGEMTTLLNRLGIRGDINRYPHQLSGGMKQRVLVAIGLAATPDLLIADEPSKGLDWDRQQDIAKLFIELRKASPHMAMLLITHDLSLAAKVADEVAVMYAGKIIEHRSKEHFFAHPAHPYSQALLAALPERGLLPLRGLAPRPDEKISGCLFHPRCSQSMEICRLEKPPQVTTQHGTLHCWYYAHTPQDS